MPDPRSEPVGRKGWPDASAVDRAVAAYESSPRRDRWWKIADALQAAGLPALVSHAEVRAILGTRNPRLPAGTPRPLYENVGGRSLWLRDDIEKFAVEFQARPNVIARRQS